MQAHSRFTSVPKPKKWVITIMPGTVASNTFCMTRGVFMGPWAWGDVTRSNAISGTSPVAELFSGRVYLVF